MTTSGVPSDHTHRGPAHLPPQRGISWGSWHKCHSRSGTAKPAHLTFLLCACFKTRSWPLGTEICGERALESRPGGVTCLPLTGLSRRFMSGPVPTMHHVLPGIQGRPGSSSAAPRFCAAAQAAALGGGPANGTSRSGEVCRSAGRSHPFAPRKNPLWHKWSTAWAKHHCRPTQWPVTVTVGHASAISSVHRGLHWSGRKSKCLHLAFKALHNLSLWVRFLRLPQLVLDVVSICGVCLPCVH